MTDQAIVHSENEYEDLLGQWADLESGLGIVLGNPSNTQQFANRIVQYDRWMRGLMHRDPDVGLYLLFQLASNSPVGYSASHALVCATLCHMLALELKLSPKSRDSLVCAAFTMNLAMTATQDELATQSEKPSAEQQNVIRTHTVKGAMMLATLGVTDDVWLEIVSNHHNDPSEQEDPRLEATVGAARILQVVDRYAAMISPRLSRAGRTAMESARAVMASTSAKSDEIGHALVQSVGLYPPGTFVRLDNDELAVVLRRSSTANMPYVVVVGRANGELLLSPRLHRLSDKGLQIRTALSASSVRAHLNHFHILQLGGQATPEA